MSTIITTTPAVNRAIAAANDLPQLVDELKQVDPALATQLTGVSLATRQSIYWPAVSALVTWGIMHFGLTWDGATHDVVTGLLVTAIPLVTAAYWRTQTTAPITSWFKKRVAPPTPANAPPPTVDPGPQPPAPK